MSYFEQISVIKGYIDSDNSTTTPLGAGGVFTGEWVNILDVGTLGVTVYSDQASADDGLELQFSTDGVNIDSCAFYNIPAANGKYFSNQAEAQYFRIKYTNGSVAQTEFRLQVQQKSVYNKPSTHRLKDLISSDDDAELVKNVQMTVGSDEEEYRNVSVQYPMPSDGDSVYAKDIDLSSSSSTDFTGGTVLDLFDDLNSAITNSTANNPKTIVISFKRGLVASGLAIGSTQGGTHSNVKIEAQRGSATWTTLNDNSSSAIAFSSRFYSFSVAAGNQNVGVVGITALRITFNTTNTIELSNIIINKVIDTIASLQALRRDGASTFIGATNLNNLKVSVQEYGDTPSIDPFARLRVSEPFTIFDSKQLHDKQPLFWDEKIGGSATSVHSSSNAETKMSVTASASDYVIRQTFQRFNYQPGKGQLILMTFHSPQATGITNRIGCFDDDGTGNNLTPNNGIFFECDGALSWNIAKDGTITETATQANWNVDKLDGTGPSEITLDMTSTQILVIDFEWLGVGRVRVGFVINGLIYYCHYFNHANSSSFSSVYMSTPNLPLRYSIETDGTNASHLDHICSTVISEGGVEKTGILTSVNNANTHVDANSIGTIYAVLGVRLKSSYIDVTVLPESFSMISKTNDSFRWSLHFNPTIAGTFTYSDITNSSLQKATGATANTVSDEGLVIASGYGSVSDRNADGDLQTALRLGSAIDGTVDELVLCVMPLSANADILGSLNVRELL